MKTLRVIICKISTKTKNKIFRMFNLKLLGFTVLFYRFSGLKKASAYSTFRHYFHVV